MFLIPALREQSQVDFFEVKTNLIYIGSSRSFKAYIEYDLCQRKIANKTFADNFILIKESSYLFYSCVMPEPTYRVTPGSKWLLLCKSGIQGEVGGRQERQTEILVVACSVNFIISCFSRTPPHY